MTATDIHTDAIGEAGFYARREAAFARAALSGIQRGDLIDLHRTIAILVGRTYAATVEDLTQISSGSAEICVAALAFDGGTPAEPLVRGILGLPELGDLGGFEALREITRLLRFFAETTCSYPSDLPDRAAWFNEITDISVEISFGLGPEGDGSDAPRFDLLERATTRLSNRFGQLWS